MNKAEDSTLMDGTEKNARSTADEAARILSHMFSCEDYDSVMGSFRKHLKEYGDDENYEDIIVICRGEPVKAKPGTKMKGPGDVGTLTVQHTSQLLEFIIGTSPGWDHKADKSSEQIVKSVAPHCKGMKIRMVIRVIHASMLKLRDSQTKEEVGRIDDFGNLIFSSKHNVEGDFEDMIHRLYLFAEADDGWFGVSHLDLGGDDNDEVVGFSEIKTVSPEEARGQGCYMQFFAKGFGDLHQAQLSRKYGMN